MNLDLTTKYMGIRLQNPLVAGASSVSRDVDQVRALEDAGIAAVVVYSLFQEEIEYELACGHYYESLGAESYAEALTFMPSVGDAPRGPHDYVEHIGKIKRAVRIPVIASLNGNSLGGWTDYARLLAQAGADGLELNLYDVVTDPDVSPADVENRYLEIFAAVKSAVAIPVAVKIGPYFTSLPHFAARLDRAGVDGLVLFNRFYQPDVDLETREVIPDLILSARHESRLPLRWIAILDPILRTSLAASTGVYRSRDVLKLLMVGADVTMLCAAILRMGPQVVGELLKGIEAWMCEHEYESVTQLQGCMNHQTTLDPTAFERANYMRALHSYV